MDLNAPLGMTPPPRPRRRLAPLVLGVSGLAALGALAAVLALADPRGGRPYAVALIPPPPIQAPTRSAPLDTTPTGTTTPSNAGGRSGDAQSALPKVEIGRPEPRAESRVGSLESGVMVFRGGGTEGRLPSAAPAGPLVIDVTRTLDDPLGKARGPAASGSGAKPAKAADAPAPPPRVAIFVSGMGPDVAATRDAIETMPAAVTLAFLPYGGALAANVDAAKAKGHEVLLQLPMRNEGTTAAGPHSLRPDAPPEATKADLAWLMDRVSGYDGIVNMLGASVTADEPTMTMVLKAAADHHVFFLDDGTSRRSVAVRLAREANVDAAASDLVLDATSDPAAIQANLLRLVALAKARGHAIGMASGAPEHLAAIARFAATLESRGVALVPVATLVHAGDMPTTPGAAAAR